MAGPSIGVRVLADLTSFAKSVTGAGQTGQTAFAGMKSGFTNMIGAINQTGVLGPFADVLDGIGKSIDSVAGHAKSVPAALIGVGTAVAGIGIGLSALGSKDQAAHQQLQAAVQATGHDYEDYGQSVEAAIKHQEKFGDTAGQTQNALTNLTTATHDPQKALDLLSLATDLAAQKHISLADASTQVGKVYNGNARLLKQYGIEIDKNTGQTKSGQTAIQALSGVLKGQGSAAADTFGGKIAGLKAHFEDTAATLGQKYGPALTAVGSVLAGVGAAVEIVTALHIGSVIGWLADAAAAAAAAVAENLALLGIPVLIAAVVAGIAWMVTHWTQVKDAVMDVWNWITAHWPLLLVILLGPFGILVDLVIKNFDTIKNAIWDVVAFFVTVWHGIADAAGFVAGLVIGAWNSVYGAIAGVASRIWGVVSGAFTGLVGVAWSVVGQVIGTFSGIVNWFFGLPGAILRAVGDLGSTLYNAGVAVVQGFINGIGSLAGAVGDKIKSIVTAPINAAKSLLGIGSPSKVFHEIGLAIPQGMANGITAGSDLVSSAMGSMLPGGGVALGAAGGGTGIPVAAGGGGGPAVVIANATFSSDLDVDSFMRRAAWVVQTQRV